MSVLNTYINPKTHTAFRALAAIVASALYLCTGTINAHGADAINATTASTTNPIPGNVTPNSPPGATKMQDFKLVNTKVKEYLETQSQGSPGRVEVTVSPIDPNLRLVACTSPEPFMPTGSRAWGRTTVGVRCNHPTPWTIYVEAQVRVYGEYVVAASSLAQGQTITQNQIRMQYGDMTSLPAGFYTNPNEVIGRTAKLSLLPGSILKQDMLKLPQVIQQGQEVRVTTTGTGFNVSAKGIAMGNASEGQIVQVRMTSGQIINGKATASGQVEVNVQ